MADTVISKIKLPNNSSVYHLVDSSALHSDDIDTTVTNTSTSKVGSASAVKAAYDRGTEAYNHADDLLKSLGSYLTFKGTKTTEAEIKSLTTAKVGDVWLETTNHSEFVCIEAINGTASANSWEKLGMDINAASSTHTHTVTYTTSTASKLNKDGSAGKAASFTQGKDTWNAGSASTWSYAYSNGTLTISGGNGTAPSFTQGTDSFTTNTPTTLPTFTEVDIVNSVTATTSAPKD